MKSYKISLVAVIILIVFTVDSVSAAINTFSLPITPIPADSSPQPDNFGYTWVDSDNDGNPVYNWIDITGIGTPVEGLMDDNAVGPFNIGFDFPFYWYYVDHLWIGSNGYISFSSDANYSQNFPMIPSPTLPNDLVCPLASDLDFTSPYGDNLCYYYSNNIDTFIVSWIGVAEWNAPPTDTRHTFQLILDVADSSITFQYGEQVGDFQNPNGACQIGIEDLVGQTGLCYMHNRMPPERMPHDSLVIRIHPDPDPDFVFHDVGVEGGLNETSGGVFTPLNQDMQIRALIKNYGTVAEEDITVTVEIKRGYLRVYSDTSAIDHIESGEEVWVEFDSAFIPDLVDVYSVIFKTTLIEDQFYYNNRDTTELRSYVLPMTLGYADTAYSYSYWIGGDGGWANEFIMPEAIHVTDITANFQSNGVYPCYFYILPVDEEENPDEENILWGDTVTVDNTGGWYTITLDQPINFWAYEKFFVTMLSGGEGNLQGFDPLRPLSNRGWEYTGSYAPSRDRSQHDICISLICNVGPAPPPCEYVPGDVNGDGNVIRNDVTYGVRYFKGLGPAPPDSCQLPDGNWIYAAGDANGDCVFKGNDITFLVYYFKCVHSEILFCHQTPPSNPLLLKNNVDKTPMNIRKK